MKAFVKNINLPDAPPPSRCSKRHIDPWEAKHYSSLSHDNFKPKENPSHKWTPKEVETIQQLWREGSSIREISETVDVNYNATARKVNYMESCGLLEQRRTKLTDKQKLRLLKDHEKGLSQKELAVKYGCSASTIFRLLKRKKGRNGKK